MLDGIKVLLINLKASGINLEKAQNFLSLPVIFSCQQRVF
jgi:hypothetical protein